MRYAYYTPSLSFNWEYEVGHARDALERIFRTVPGSGKSILKEFEKLTDIADITARRDDMLAKFPDKKEDVEFIYWYLVNRNVGADFMKCLVKYPGQQTMCQSAQSAGIAPELFLTQAEKEEARIRQLQQLQQAASQPATDITPIVKGVSIFLFASMLLGAVLWYFKKS